MRGGEKVLDGHLRALSGGAALTAWCTPGLRLPRIERHADQDVVRAATARRGAFLPAIPAALPRRRRAFRSRRLRPGHQHEPLRGEVGRPAGPGRARQLLPLAHALRLGSVRGVLRPGAGRAGRKPAAAAGHGGAGALGSRRPRDGSTASWPTPTMLRAGSADTIIAGRPSCILL